VLGQGGMKELFSATNKKNDRLETEPKMKFVTPAQTLSLSLSPLLLLSLSFFCYCFVLFLLHSPSLFLHSLFS
jgi:hypothetical protein